MIIDSPPVQHPPAAADTAILRVDQLVKRYADNTAVDGVSFSVREGSCFGLLGPNGAGKTTTIEIMEGILAPTAGTVSYRGASLGERFRHEAGILFQKTALQDFLSVRQTLEMFRGLYDHGLSVEEVIRLCALDKLLKRDNKKLSGGQLQRLLLGVALVNDPHILFLDEPTTGLDPQARRRFWELVESIKAQRKTIILTTHNMDEAQLLCDEIVIMDHGKIIAQGAPETLLRQHFKAVLIELPSEDWTPAARALGLSFFEAAGRVELTTNDLEGTLRTLLQSGVPLAHLRIRPPNLEDLFLELTGTDLRFMSLLNNLRRSGKRLIAVWHARNLEFVRDRSSLIFTLGMPVAIVVAMALIFGGPPRPMFKVGVLGAMPTAATYPFIGEHYFQFVPEPGQAAGIHSVARSDLDLLLDMRQRPVRFWALEDSPKGYMAEKLLLQADPQAQHQRSTGAVSRYIDWLFPGVLGMNMMFTCLMGAGYVVVRYRKNGFLKRLSATPVSAFEFLSAQVLSRLGLALAITLILYSGIGTVIHFHNAGSNALLFLVAVLGCLSLIAFGLIVAARFASEEVVGGMLNLLTWPMMLLSGIWFSLEGSPRWMQWLAQLFPLTHILQAVRVITLDGAGAEAIGVDLAYLAGTTLVFLAIGAATFRWRPE